MASIDQKAMLDAGVHFGHLRKKWNPKMLPYIFAEKKGIHVIDLNKTASKLEEAGNVLRNMAKNDKIILFVATKKQAKDIVKKAALSCESPYVVERWLGGMLTNFSTIRKSVRKMQSIDRMFKDGTVKNITKKERLMLSRQKDKLENVLGGIANLNRLPNAVFVVDILHEDISIAECKRLGITTLGMVDTNSDPNKVNFAIPANDDSSRSIEYITNYLAECVNEGKKERGAVKDDSQTEEGAEAGAEGTSDASTEAKPRVRKSKEVSSETTEVVTETVEVPAEVVMTSTEETTTVEEIVSAPTTEVTTTDDLKVIEGVGPAIEKLLQTNGINTYADVVSHSADAIKAILTEAGPSMAMHDPSTWAEQAQLLKDGKMDEFKALTDALNGGKRD